MSSSTIYPELSEEERFPILSDRGRELLHRLRQHPSAPLWNWPNGEQLDDKGLERVRRFANSLDEPRSEKPDWLDPYVERCLREVPFYRKRACIGMKHEYMPTCGRADLASRVSDFIPDDEPLDQLITFSSSGTTGYPTRTAHHPFSAACGVPLMEHALKSLGGISFRRSPDEVAITNIAAYPGAFTTAIVVSFLDEAGCIRVNLDSSAWRAQGDCQRYIDEWESPIWLGDPIAFAAMEKLSLRYQPQAILSSIMHLSDSYAERLQSRFGCPVIDLYAMTEAGIIAAKVSGTDQQQVHRILPHDLYVEVLDAEGNDCPDGVRGEITLTGGRNPFLPLLRYKTGDFASLATLDGHRCLLGLEGRQPVEYKSVSGRIVHSMEITRLMRRYPVVRYEMKRTREGKCELQYQGDVDVSSLRAELSDLFGESIATKPM